MQIIACEFCGKRAGDSSWEKKEGRCPSCGRHPKEEFLLCEYCGHELHVIDWMEADGCCTQCGKQLGKEVPEVELEGAACARCGGVIYRCIDMPPAMDDIWGRYRCGNCGLVDGDFVPYRDP